MTDTTEPQAPRTGDYLEVDLESMTWLPIPR